MTDPTPIEADEAHAKVHLKRGDAVWYWIVRKCPFCGKKHQHGGGSLDSDPRTFLGGRASHCGRGHYVLVEKGTK